MPALYAWFMNLLFIVPIIFMNYFRSIAPNLGMRWKIKTPSLS